MSDSYFDEREHLVERLYEKADAEYKARLSEIEKLTPKEIMSTAYEIVLKEDILSSLESPDFLDIAQLTVLCDLDKPLDYVYEDWLDNDFSYMKDLRTTIESCADAQISVSNYDVATAPMHEDEQEI